MVGWHHWQRRVWPNSRRCWRIGKSGMLQSMGSQRVGHDWDWKTTVFRGGGIILPNSAGNSAFWLILWLRCSPQEMWVWLNIRGNCSNTFPLIFFFFRWLHQMPMEEFCSIYCPTNIKSKGNFYGEISHKLCAIWLTPEVLLYIEPCFWKHLHD